MAHHSRSTLIIAADPANKSKTQQPSPKSLAFFAVTANPASTYISPYAQNLDIPAPSQPDSTSTSINPNIKELSSQENSEPFAHASKSSSSPEILVPNSSSGKMSSSQMISAVSILIVFPLLFEPTFLMSRLFPVNMP